MIDSCIILKFENDKTKIDNFIRVVKSTFEIENVHCICIDSINIQTLIDENFIKKDNPNLKNNQLDKLILHPRTKKFLTKESIFDYYYHCKIWQLIVNNNWDTSLIIDDRVKYR